MLKFRFDTNRQYQRDAIDAVAGFFLGPDYWASSDYTLQYNQSLADAKNFMTTADELATVQKMRK